MGVIIHRQDAKGSCLVLHVLDLSLYQLEPTWMLQWQDIDMLTSLIIDPRASRSIGWRDISPDAALRLACSSIPEYLEPFMCQILDQ